MIKTMLLTAQLALSPIVGTNGLQPKRLPNPVYGETIDYSVTYNGETYQRIGYNNLNEFASVSDSEVYLQMRADNLNEWVSPELAWAYETNLPKLTGDYWIHYFEGDWNMPEGRYCFSFWEYNDDGIIDYIEVFWDWQSQDAWEVVQTEWEANKTYSDQWVMTGQNAFSVFDWYDGQTIYFYEENLGVTWPTTAERTIPAIQPTTANPSVYDNIYNFYYQNLFANEALDELGAEVGNNSLTMRQWLAHTATIVSISLLSAALVVLVIKIFKLIAGSISEIWG